MPGCDRAEDSDRADPVTLTYSLHPKSRESCSSRSLTNYCAQCRTQAAAGQGALLCQLTGAVGPGRLRAVASQTQPDRAFWDLAVRSCGYIRSRQAVSNSLTTKVA